MQRGFETEVFWNNEKTLEEASCRLDLHLSELKVNSQMYSCLQSDASYLQKIEKWRKQLSYDLIFWLSDGAIPFLHAKQNWIHFQVPFNINGNSFLTQYKLTKINSIICNSQFTKKNIDKSFKVESEVIYPPVAVHNFMLNPQKKEKIILSVGRFDQIMNAKRQDVLIEVFKKMCDEGFGGWRLILAGGLQNNQQELLKLQEMALDYPIEFEVNASWEKIVDLYKKASIYWHGAGFEVDQENNPEATEHFGMSTVEAMAAACVPIVYKAGGIPEIITDKENGYLWQGKDQLQKMTINIANNLAKESEVVKNAVKRSLQFSKEIFFGQFDKRLT